jgi:steroid delta-isomerase-like uncharacterized protein
MAKKNKAIVRHWIKELDKHNFEIMDEIVSPDVTFHFPGNTMTFDAYKQFVNAVYEGLPDLHHEIEDMIAEGDRVAMRVTDSGTHNGVFMGVPPTGNKVTVSAMAIFRLAEGKIVEGWEEMDMQNLMQQLETIP